jgi:hypothetical protein
MPTVSGKSMAQENKLVEDSFFSKAEKKTLKTMQILKIKHEDAPTREKMFASRHDPRERARKNCAHRDSNWHRYQAFITAKIKPCILTES